MNDAAQYHVLLVDDEKLVRFTISAFLRRHGFDVVEAASPAEAMASVKRTHYDAIISDVMMGDIDGFVFRDMIRQFDATVPVVFLTSMVNDYGNWLLKKISEDVRSYFVTKGEALDMLESRVRRIIASYETERENEKIKRDFDTGLELASFVQRSLLPPWVNLFTTYQYGVAWSPFEQVSGDLYELVQLSATTCLVICGDVSGHGIRSALAMTGLQSYMKRFHEYDDRRASNVCAVARGLHEFISTNLRDIVYMVGVVIYVDFGHNRIRFVNAGMPPIRCVRAGTGEHVDLNPGNRGAMPFGLMPGATYTEDDVVEATFADDDVFIVTTDGVLDCHAAGNADETVPEDFFANACSVVVESDAQSGMVGQTASAILKAVHESGYEQAQDDQTVIVFRKTSVTKGQIVKEVPVRPEKIDAFAQLFGAFARELTGDLELESKVSLLLDEFLMNVYNHGLDNYSRLVDYAVVMGRLVGGNFELTVWDRGRSWNVLSDMTLEDAQKKLDERNVLMAGSGRGTAIMRMLSEGGVQQDRIGEINRTVLRIPYQARRENSQPQ